MFNFTLEPTETTRIQHGSVYVDIPVYNDLLGEEFDAFEVNEQEEAAWNQKLIALTEELAAKKGKSLYETAMLMSQAELATPEQKAEILGEYLTNFTQLVLERPNENKKLYRIAEVLLRRVDAGINKDTVSKLPRKFLQKVYDFALSEQGGSTYIPNQELEAQLTTQNEEIRALRQFYSSVCDIKNSAVQRAVEDFKKAGIEAGKDDTPTI